MEVEAEAVVDALMIDLLELKVNSDAPRPVVDNALVRDCLADCGEILGP
jgi:hypothetical protein